MGRPGGVVIKRSSKWLLATCNLQLAYNLSFFVSDGVEISTGGKFGGVEFDLVGAFEHADVLGMLTLAEHVEHFELVVCVLQGFDDDGGLAAERVGLVADIGDFTVEFVGAVDTIGDAAQDEVVVGARGYLAGKLNGQVDEGGTHQCRDAQIGGVGGIGCRGCAMYHDATEGIGQEYAVWRVTGIGETDGQVGNCAGCGYGYAVDGKAGEGLGYFDGDGLVVRLIDAGVEQVVKHVRG